MTAPATHRVPVRDERLAAIARIAEAADAPELEREARSVAERLDEGRFFVAVLGQFKRGKSTLINALAGEPLLPTGVAPVTSVVTIVRHGSRTLARVRLREGDWQLIDVDQLWQYTGSARWTVATWSIEPVKLTGALPLQEETTCVNHACLNKDEVSTDDRPILRPRRWPQGSARSTRKRRSSGELWPDGFGTCRRGSGFQRSPR